MKLEERTFGTPCIWNPSDGGDRGIKTRNDSCFGNLRLVRQDSASRDQRSSSDVGLAISNSI